MENNKSQILIVDDEPDIREILDSLLTGEGFACRTAADVDGALAELRRQAFDLVFTDIRMPGRPIQELLEEIREAHPGSLVVMITGLNTAETAMECIHLGAYDYIVKPFNLSQVVLAAKRALATGRLERSNREFQNYLEQMVEERAAETQRLFYSMTQVLVRLLELRIPFDVGHSVNVAEISRHVARELKMTKDGVRKVYLAALLHDVGMIPVEDLLLHKKESLTLEEYRQIQEHTCLAEVVLKPILDDDEVLKYIRHHHERYDGGGYPDGLKGNIIPLGARIIAVAEAFDSMTRCRPHRSALSVDMALLELESCADTQFDRQVVAVFTGAADQILPQLQPPQKPAGGE